MTEQGKFRKKPVVIEAIQWRGAEDDMVLSRFIPHSLWCRNSDGQPCVKTLESGKGFHIVSAGDWIIKGVKGEFYPIKPDIFAETYEPTEGASPAAGPELEVEIAYLPKSEWPAHIVEKLRQFNAPKHKIGCPRQDYWSLIEAKREEGEGSQAAGLDEEDFPCNCGAEGAASPETLRKVVACSKCGSETTNYSSGVCMTCECYGKPSGDEMREKAREWYSQKLQTLPPNYETNYWMNVVDLLAAFASRVLQEYKERKAAGGGGSEKV